MKLTKIFTLLCAAATLMVGCGGDNGNEVVPTGDIILTADREAVDTGESVTFTVTTIDGHDVTANATFFNRTANFATVENPYTPTEEGIFEIFAVVGESSSSSVTITVTPETPELPADPQPENLSFNHRILLVDHTGKNCGYCPYMMTALKEVSETEGYHVKYHEAMAHTYSTADPAWSSAADFVSGHFSRLISGTYPSLTYNYAYGRKSSYDVVDIKQTIDLLWNAEGADAGIAVATSVATKSVVVNAEVKAAVEAEYRINAWLLEDNLVFAQAGKYEEWHNTHNNAIRQLAYKSHISGESLGTIAAGDTAEKVMLLPITSEEWNRDNLKVMVIVSRQDAANNNNWEVVNVVVCPANEAVTYDYITE